MLCNSSFSWLISVRYCALIASFKQFLRKIGWVRSYSCGWYHTHTALSRCHWSRLNLSGLFLRNIHSDLLVILVFGSQPDHFRDPRVTCYSRISPVFEGPIFGHSAVQKNDTSEMLLDQDNPESHVPVTQTGGRVYVMVTPPSILWWPRRHNCVRFSDETVIGTIRVET